MDAIGLAVDIRDRALALGYEKCGIIGVQEMNGYADALARRMEEYPTDRPILEKFNGFADVYKMICNGSCSSGINIPG